MAFKKVKPAAIAFDLYASSELLSSIHGTAIAGSLAERLNYPIATVSRWLSKGVPARRQEEFLDRLPPDAKDGVAAIRAGKFEHHSPLGSYLYQVLGDRSTIVDETLKLLHQSILNDLTVRKYVRSYPLSSLRSSIWGVELRDDDACSPERLDPPESIPSHLLRSIEADRTATVRLNFLVVLASLDIDICLAFFPKHEIRMIVPTVMPEIRQRPGKPEHPVRPERKFADLLGATFLNVEYPPTLDVILGRVLDGMPNPRPPFESLAEKLKDGTVYWDDYNRLMDFWTFREPPKKIPVDHDEPRRWADRNLNAPEYEFTLLMYVTMKICSFAYEGLHKQKGIKDKLQNFFNDYAAVWQQLLVIRGLKRGSGIAWDETRLQKIIRDMVIEDPPPTSPAGEGSA